MPGLSLHIEYMELPTDGKFCYVCDSMIIGKMFQQVIFVDLEPCEQDVRLCEYCYNEMNDTAAKEWVFTTV